MRQVELFVGDPINTKLDISQNFSLLLNYSAADIKDISKKDSQFSEQFTLPGSETNKKFFGHLYDEQATFEFFNPNFKTPARVLIDSNLVIEGYLQLNAVRQSFDLGVEFDVVIYSNVIDFWTDLGESRVNELDMQEFGHTFSKQSIEDSWGHGWTQGYVYPLYYNSDAFYETTDFYPAVFLRQVVDKIFDNIGYGYTGSLVNNDEFNREIIPYVGEATPKIGETERNRRQFRAGVTGSQIFQCGTVSATQSTTPGQSYFPITSTRLVFNDTQNSPNYDNDNNYATASGVWTVDRNGFFDINLNMGWKLLFNNNTGLTASSSGTSRYTTRIEIIKKNGANQQTLLSDMILNAIAPATINPGTQSGQVWNSPFKKRVTNVELNIGDEIYIEARVDLERMSYVDSVNNGLEIPVSIEIEPNCYATPTYFYNVAREGIVRDGDLINLNDYLPEKLKQKSILEYIQKRWNCLIFQSPDNPRLINFEPKVSYYSETTTLDWTDKADISSREIKFLSALQSKRVKFLKGDDSDEWNEYYVQQTDEVPGQYEWNFPNEFQEGESEIRLPFSATPLTQTVFGAAVPAIKSSDPKLKPRILYWGGLIKDPDNSGIFWALNWVTSSGSQSQTTYSSYPYAGNYDNPFNPTVNIDFSDQKLSFYYNQESTTTNNAFNKYWRSTMVEIETGKLVIMNVDLSPNDIENIKDNFNYRIFIDGNYYYINRINNFNATSQELTQVEFILIETGIQYDTEQVTEDSSGGIVIPPPPRGDFDVIGVVTGGFNVIGAADSNIVAGKKNRLENTNNTFSIGDSNILLDDSTYNVGDFNSVQGEFSGIIGGENNVINANQTMVLNASGLTASEEGSIYLCSQNTRVRSTGNIFMDSTEIETPQYTLDVNEFSLTNTTSLKALNKIQNPIRIDDNFQTGSLQTSNTSISSRSANVTTTAQSVIIGGEINTIGAGSTNSVIISGSNHEIIGFTNSVVIGGDSIQATASNTVHTSSIYNTGGLRLETESIIATHSWSRFGANVFLCDSFFNPIQISIPKDEARLGDTIFINTGPFASTNAITFKPPTGKTIDGASSLVISTNYQGRRFVADSSQNWFSI